MADATVETTTWQQGQELVGSTSGGMGQAAVCRAKRKARHAQGPGCTHPLAPDAAECRLCEAPIAGTLQDHLLAGQPGTTRLEAAICPRCGEGLRRLVEVFGPELSFVVQDHRQAVEHLIGGPAARKAIARSRADRAAPAPPRATLERSRQHLTEEADQLAHTERVLRAEADTLARLGGPDVDG